MKIVSCSNDPVVGLTEAASKVVFLNPNICESFEESSARNTFHRDFRSDRSKQLSRINHETVEALNLGCDGCVSPVVPSQDRISHDGLQEVLGSLGLRSSSTKIEELFGES